MRSSMIGGGLAALVLVVLLGCNGEEVDHKEDVGGADAVDDVDDIWQAPQGTAMRFRPDSQEFFDLPFPDDLRRGDGAEEVFMGWPGATSQPLLELWFSAADELLDGWGLSSGIFAYFTDSLDPSTLPADADASVDFEGAYPSVFLVDVDGDSSERGEVYPITCQYREQEGSYHDARQVGCISPFGVIRRPNTTYALVITDALLDEEGESVVPDEAMARLLAGLAVEGVDGQPYEDALAVVDELGVDSEAVTGMVLFTTHDPSERLRRINAWYRELPTPSIDAELGLTVVESYDDFVVVEGYYDVPVIQEGERPYDHPPSGRILFDDQGDPEMVDDQSIRFFLTIPRAQAGERGYPTLFYLHGSGGVADELLHRGARPDTDTPAPEGSGPGGVVAPYGIAGFAADFNLHGMRHSPRDTTGLKLYNLVENPRAAIDNFIIAANEVGLHARLMEGLEFDVDDVEGLAELMPEGVEVIHFDSDAFAAMGQSMGSTIGLPALTVDDRIDAGIFSGSGGVLIEVALESVRPVNVGAMLRLVLGYRSDEELDPYDPILSAVQHPWDLVDPVAHGRFLVDEPHPGQEPTHSLQHSGLDDGYFSPISRAAFSTALGGQLVEPLLEEEALDQMRWRDLDQVLELPVQGNSAGTTNVVTQYEPSVMDGHNVAFQRDDAKAQYACFVKSLTWTDTPILRSVEASSLENCVE